MDRTGTDRIGQGGAGASHAGLRAAAALALLALLALAAELPPAAAGARTVTAVFPPWWSTGRVWRAAGSAGAVVNGGASSFVLVLHASTPGLADRARRAGALLLLDPRGFGGCGSAVQGPQP